MCLGFEPRGCSMVVTDRSTELWRPPNWMMGNRCTLCYVERFVDAGKDKKMLLKFEIKSFQFLFSLCLVFRGEVYCSTDYVIIPQGSSGGDGIQTFDRFCGQALNDRVAADQPASSVPITSKLFLLNSFLSWQHLVWKLSKFWTEIERHNFSAWLIRS